MPMHSNPYPFSIALTFLASVGAASADISWGTGGATTVFGPDGVTALTASRDDAVGCFVQLINAGPNGQIDPINTAIANGAGGDDTVVDAAWLGASTISPVNGRLASQGEAHVPGNTYFVRGWNAPTPSPQGTSTTGFSLSDGNESQAAPLATATHYGNSATITTPANGNPADNIAFNFGLITNLPFGTPNITLATAGGQNVITQTTVSFPHTLTGGGSTVSFVIGNNGTGTLNLTTVQAFGDFSVTTPPPGTLNPGATSPMVITFTPSAGGIRNGVLQILSNDPDQGSLNVTLTGRGFVPTADDDGDSVPNSSEFGLEAFGFDPTVNDSGLVTTLRSNGFYQTSDVGNLALGRPLLQRDSATGNFRLGLGFQKSATLTGWTPLLGYTLDYDVPSGSIEIEFSSGGSSPEFYRVWGEPAAP